MAGYLSQYLAERRFDGTEQHIEFRPVQVDFPSGNRWSIRFYIVHGDGRTETFYVRCKSAETGLRWARKLMSRLPAA